MNRHPKIFKTSSGLSTGKALLNHIIFSPSQTVETVPLIALYKDEDIPSGFILTLSLPPVPGL
jgi:hypothetical protein